MLTDPIPFPDHAGGVANAVRVNQDGNAADYFVEKSGDKLRARVAHTVPKPGKDGESHLFRLDVDRYADGKYLRTDSVWVVCRTTGGAQDTPGLLETAKNVLGVLTASQHRELGKVLGRQV